METIGRYMTRIHRLCDANFAAAEAAITSGRWEQSAISFECFCRAVEHHFAAEEGVLFPAFEEAVGGKAGPANVMRDEHERMRGVIRAMAASLRARDAGEYLGQSETLATFMQQHNVKEESMLYPMIEQVLAQESSTALYAMRLLRHLQG
jgi:iron-sulfur cluster repair protein YtfE (RIC family)